jgi:hypothetical protein
VITDAVSPNFFDVPPVRDELQGLVATWQGALPPERGQHFRANLAYLLDLAIGTALELHRRELRDGLAAPIKASEVIDEAIVPLRPRSTSR